MQCSFESRYGNLHFIMPCLEKDDCMKNCWLKLEAELEAGTGFDQ